MDMWAINLLLSFHGEQFKHSIKYLEISQKLFLFCFSLVPLCSCWKCWTTEIFFLRGWSSLLSRNRFCGKSLSQQLFWLKLKEIKFVKIYYICVLPLSEQEKYIPIRADCLVISDTRVSQLLINNRVTESQRMWQRSISRWMSSSISK